VTFTNSVSKQISDSRSLSRTSVVRLHLAAFSLSLSLALALALALSLALSPHSHAHSHAHSHFMLTLTHSSPGSWQQTRPAARRAPPTSEERRL